MSMIPGAGESISEDDAKPKDFDNIPPTRDVKMHWIEATAKYKDEDSSYCRVEATAEILDGPHTGRRIWEGWTLSGSGVNTEVANRIFNQVCYALNFPTRVGEPDQLLNIPFLGDIKINKGTGGYSDKNGIGQYKRFDPLGAKPATNGASSGSAKPWARK